MSESSSSTSLKPVRVRFAPSPTGALHIGSLRTVLFAWLLARHTGGKFLLRIEDTDQVRKVPGAVRGIIEDLAWFGIDIDEGPSRAELNQVGDFWEEAPDLGGDKGPYIQSLRAARYREIAEQLVASGHAYRCDMTAEQLEAERQAQIARKETPGYSGYSRNRNVPADVPHVIRFKMPLRQTVILDDVVKGRVRWESPPLRDPVLLKSDGLALYHLAVVVDDHDMEISHVIRADEWIPTAPIHILLYEALGWEKPIFAHVPPVLGSSGKKLSKRDGATSVSNFKDDGYLPEALMNYLAMVGWSPGDGEEQEIFSRAELIERFSLERVQPSGGVFDYNKLSWINGVYIRNLPLEEFLSRARPFCESKLANYDEGKFKPIAHLVQERVKVLTEVPEMIEFLYVDQLERELDGMFKKGMTPEMAVKVLQRSYQELEQLPGWEVPEIERVLREISTELELKVGPMFTVVRIGALGKAITPPLFESLQCIGKEAALKRIKEAEVAVAARVGV